MKQKERLTERITFRLTKSAADDFRSIVARLGESPSDRLQLEVERFVNEHKPTEFLRKS